MYHENDDGDYDNDHDDDDDGHALYYSPGTNHARPTQRHYTSMVLFHSVLNIPIPTGAGFGPSVWP